MNFRTWMKRTKGGRLFWRVFIGTLGGSVTVLGAIALVGPGPGVLVVLAGLGILATEFAWAGDAMLKTRTYAQRAADRVGIPKWATYMMIAGGAAISIVAILIYHARQ